MLKRSSLWLFYVTVVVLISGFLLYRKALQSPEYAVTRYAKNFLRPTGHLVGVSEDLLGFPLKTNENGFFGGTPSPVKEKYRIGVFGGLESIGLGMWDYQNHAVELQQLLSKNSGDNFEVFNFSQGWSDLASRTKAIEAFTEKYGLDLIILPVTRELLWTNTPPKLDSQWEFFWKYLFHRKDLWPEGDDDKVFAGPNWRRNEDLVDSLDETLRKLHVDFLPIVLMDPSFSDAQNESQMIAMRKLFLRRGWSSVVVEEGDMGKGLSSLTFSQYLFLPNYNGQQTIAHKVFRFMQVRGIRR